MDKYFELRINSTGEMLFYIFDNVTQINHVVSLLILIISE